MAGHCSVGCHSASLGQLATRISPLSSSAPLLFLPTLEAGLTSGIFFSRQGSPDLTLLWRLLIYQPTYPHVEKPVPNTQGAAKGRSIGWERMCLRVSFGLKGAFDIVHIAPGLLA